MLDCSRICLSLLLLNQGIGSGRGEAIPMGSQEQALKRNWLLGAAEELTERETMKTQMESVPWQSFPAKITFQAISTVSITAHSEANNRCHRHRRCPAPRSARHCIGQPAFGCGDIGARGCLRRGSFPSRVFSQGSASHPHPCHETPSSVLAHPGCRDAPEHRREAGENWLDSIDSTASPAI